MRAMVREAFAAAAGRYPRGNPVLEVEREETSALLPPLGGRDVLDLGSGPGHYARLAAKAGARRVVALDLTPEMLARGAGARVAADAAGLPFRDGAFDVVVAAMVLGYLGDRRRAFAEMARVLRPRGTLVLSDLHPTGADRGWQRTFDGRDGTVAVPWRADSLTETAFELRVAGFAIDRVGEPAIDGRLEPHFRRAGRTDFAAVCGIPLLVLVLAHKGDSHVA